jgi:predicted secreted protein
MRKLGMNDAALALSCACILLGACRSAPEPVAISEGAAKAPEPSSAATPSAPEPRAPKPAPTYDASTKRIEAKVGERFTVALPANIATPMRWRIAAPASSQLSAPTESYHDAPPAECTGCTGYAGTRMLSFEALQAGTTTLKLAYGSLTDPSAPPEREVVIEVLIQAK